MTPSRGREGSWLRKGLATAAVLVALALLAAMASRSIRREEREFDRRGRDVVELLDRMGAALAARDLSTLEQIYDKSFRGKRLGLADLSQEWPQILPKGARIVRLHQVAPGMARPAVALAEWRDYLAGFDEIEQVRMRLERLDRWRWVWSAPLR